MAKYKLKPEVKCFPFGVQCAQVVNEVEVSEKGEPNPHQTELTDSIAEYLLASGKLSENDFEELPSKDGGESTPKSKKG
jgi:hypothetical protein